MIRTCGGSWTSGARDREARKTYIHRRLKREREHSRRISYRVKRNRADGEEQRVTKLVHPGGRQKPPEQPQRDVVAKAGRRGQRSGEAAVAVRRKKQRSGTASVVVWPCSVWCSC